MTLSIFTPTHDASFLPDVYASIKDQPFDEWVIVHNNGSQPIALDDPRVKQLVLPCPVHHIGALKRYACSQCSGDILLELDHDDILLTGAVQAAKDAFAENPSAGFIYSNAVRCTGDFQPVPRFAAGNGWEYRQYEHLEELVSFPPHPSTVSRIWYAPDHLRAFRRSAYETAGGYSDEMRVLDDLDLMCRLYQVAPFHHIDRPLYLYRIHGQNSWLKHSDEIQGNVMRIHQQYIEGMAAEWAQRAGLSAIDLGGRFGRPNGYTSVDLKDADVTADLNQPWPFADGSVGVVRAFDIIEHLRDPLHVMRELWRVLCPGGLALIQVPSTDGRGAWQDPTHVSFWNENSFLYYTDANWAKYIDTPARFQAVMNYTTPLDERRVCWTRAHLLKLDAGIRIPGPVLI